MQAGLMGRISFFKLISSSMVVRSCVLHWMAGEMSTETQPAATSVIWLVFPWCWNNMQHGFICVCSWQWLQGTHCSQNSMKQKTTESTRKVLCRKISAVWPSGPKIKYYSVNKILFWSFASFPAAVNRLICIICT